MIYKTDYHIHTKFSDGKEAPEEYINAAISAGLREIGFSEHLNLVIAGQEWCMEPTLVQEYISYIRNLKKKVSGIEIRTGLEVDFFPGKEEEIYKFISKLDLDYVIGSVHYLGDTTVDSGPEFFQDKKIDEIYELFFSYLEEAVASGLFDIIGHCDLLRIYNFKPESDPEPYYRRLAANMKRHDVAFEINTNGRNRPLGDFYPDRKFLRIFWEQNVPVCVNSDAHFPGRVGQYFDEAYNLLKETGYTEMAVFKKRDRYMVPADF